MGEARSPESEEIVWNGVTRAETIGETAAALRDALADAARAGRWGEVLNLLDGDPSLVNVSRLGSKSMYAPLHQAAHHGAPADVVQAIIEAGAWRSLRNSDGERPAEIAYRRGNSWLTDLLTPVMKRRAASDTISAIRDGFHRLVRERASDLVDREGLRLPELEPILEYDDVRCWFPVPGMYGGFAYWIEIDETNTRLHSESWCRVVEGSEQNHVITADGCALVDDA